MELDEQAVPIDDLLLDPNNYRFQDDTAYVSAEDSRFADDSVQLRALGRIRREGLSELKSSILANGFLPFERIVVRPFGDAKYLVLEGNRRVAALKWIAEDNEAGVTPPDEVKETLGAVPVIVVGAGEQEDVHLSLMGVRHVGGIREWGGYQRAKLVTQLRDGHDLESSEVAARLGLTTNEVNRRYRAYKALNQMENDDEFGDLALPSMYPLFHEAVALPVVREWLGWSEADSAFSNREELSQFYSLITPTDDGTGEVQDPKLPTRAEVRELKVVLTVPEAKTVLLDPSRSFGEALGMAKAEELQRSWRAQIAEALSALTNIGALELQGLGDEETRDIERLADLAQQVLEARQKLRAS